MRAERGFSLTELVVAMLVSTVFAAATLGYFRSQTRALGTQSLTIDATDKIRSAMTLLVRELRGTGYDPKATALAHPGFTGVRYAGSTAVWIELDRNGDGLIQADAPDPSAESILYSYDSTGQRIVRTTAGVAQTVITNVPPGGFAFSYFDKAGSALSPNGSGSVTLPAGYPPLPSAVAQALGAGSALGAADRDSVAMIRVSLRVTTAAGASAITLSLGTRVSVPNRLLDRL